MLRSRLAIANASKTLHPASGRIDTRESGERESLSLSLAPTLKPRQTLDSREKEIQGTLDGEENTGTASWGLFFYDQFTLEY